MTVQLLGNLEPFGDYSCNVLGNMRGKILGYNNEAPQITIEWMDEPAYCHEIGTEEVVDQPWFHEVKRYLES